MIDFALRDDERLLDDAARRFADELRRDERTHEAERGYSHGVRARYAALGFVALSAQVSLATAARVWARLAEGDPTAPIALSAMSRARSEPGAAVVVDELTATVAVPWVPCAAPRWLAIVAPDRVALAIAPRVEALAGAPCGLRAAGASRVVADRYEPIGDAAEAARWLVELRVLAAACMLGAARDAAAYARRYACERVAFGRPIAHHQGLAFQLVDAATELAAAELALAAAAAAEDPASVAGAHALVADIALRVAERSLQALGGHGYLHDHPVEKRMRDIRAIASLYGGAIAAERDHAEHVLALRDALEVPT